MKKQKDANFTIYGRLSGLNEYTRACRSYAVVGNRMKQENEARIIGEIQKQLEDKDRFIGKVFITFKWYEPNAKRDLDNVCFAKKFILDALVTSGVICADSRKGVSGFVDEFFIDKDNPRIEVYITGE